MLKRLINTRPERNRRSWDRLTAMLCAAVMLFSSCGSALAANNEPKEKVISNPLIAPIPAPSLLPPETEGADAETMLAPEGGETPEGETAESETPAEGAPEETPTAETPAEEKVYEAGQLTAAGEGWNAVLRYPAEAKIPADAVLTLTELKGSELYSRMKTAAVLLKNDINSPWHRELDNNENHFFTATITDAEGKQIIPEAEVTLTYQNENHNADCIYFCVGEVSRMLDSDNGSIRFPLTRGESFGFGTVHQVQVGTVELTAQSWDYNVTASFGPEAGLPAGTELQVREIMRGTPEYEHYSGITNEALGEDWNEITLERYFDIAYVSEGEKVDPQADVDVEISFLKKIKQNEDRDVQTVQIENNEATVIESEKESTRAARFDSEAIDTVAFASDTASVSGVVQITKITEKILAADGNTYEIEVTYGPESEIPEGAGVKVAEIPEGSDLWEAYRKQTAAALNADDVRLPGLYDISIVDAEGNNVEPKAPVNVAIRLANAENTSEELQVVHFTEEMPQALVEAERQSAEQTDIQPIAEEDRIASETISASVEGDKVTFDTESFSVYAFAYTVNFEYMGVGYEMLGNSEILLSKLLEVLKTGADISSVTSVSYTGSAMELSESGDGDWLIKVIPNAEEQSVLTVRTSDKIIEISVAATGKESLDLGDAVISAANGVYLPDKAKGHIISDDENEEVISLVQENHDAETQQGTPDAAEEEQQPVVSETRYQVYDISLENVDAENYESGFQVDMKLSQEIRSDNVHLYHVHGDQVSEITDFELKDNSLSFVTENFSYFVITYTVDFTYVDEEGNEHFWQFPGTGSHKVSEVLTELGIEAEEITAADLERIETVGEYGEKDLYLTQYEETGEWYINSDAAFDDTYKLTVIADGETYVITVTDASNYHTIEVSISPDITLPSPLYIVVKQSVYIYQDQYNQWSADQYFYKQLNITKEKDHIIADNFTENGRSSNRTYDDSVPTEVYLARGTTNGGYIYSVNALWNNNDVYIYSDSNVNIDTNGDTTTITIGNVGPVEHTARIYFYDEWSDTVNETANLVSGYTLEATVGEDIYEASITGSGDLNFTKDGGTTNNSILPDAVSAWTFKYNDNAQSAPITLGDYVISNANPAASNHVYTFEARKPRTYTINLTYQDSTGAEVSAVTLTEGYVLQATGQDDTVYTASVNTNGTLANWQSINSQTLPQAVASFQFLDAQGQMVNKLDNYNVALPANMNPSDGQYTIALAEPLVCTASITVDSTSDLTDGDYYIVAAKDSEDVGYYKIGATADNITFTAFASGTVPLDTATSFRVVKLETYTATSAEAFAATPDVAGYSGAKIGENRYTWELDDVTYKYAFSVVPDILPPDTLRQVVVNLYCHDGTTLVDDTAATPDAKEGLTGMGKKMVIVARLEDKDQLNDDPARIIGFQAVGKDFDGHGHYDGIYFKNSFTGLEYKQDWNGYNGAENVEYDSAKHDISIRLYVVDSGFNIGNTVDSYNNLRNQAEAPEDYAFKSAPNGNVTSGVTTMLNLQKALSTKYQVKVLFDEAAVIPESQKIYLYVQAQHETSGIDKFAELVTSATPVTELTYVLYDPNSDPVSGWTQNNGGKFTGNETVQYGLYFLKQGDTLQVDQLNENSVSEISEGGYVYGNTVSYTKQRTIEEINNQNVITDYVVLTRIPTDSDYNFQSVLGNGLYFGITANELTQGNDLQTNFACNTFKHEDHSVTPNLSGSSSGTFYIGEMTGSQVQINSAGNNTTCTIYVGEDSKDQIMPGSNVIVMPTAKANIGNIVNPILAHGKAVSDDMAKHAPTMNIVVPKNANSFVLDTRAFPDDATIYIDGDYLAGTGILGITDGLKIWKHENQVIVFNFKTTESVTSNQYMINGVSSATQTSQGTEGNANAGSDRLARGVVWNMNKKGGSFNAGTTLGIILAPNNGTVDIAKGNGSSGAGWIIANTVKNWGGEWHNIYADMPAVNKAIINAKKFVNERNAKGREKFLFKLERYNTEKNWVVVKENEQNHGSAIEFTNVDVNDTEHDCWTIYKITETAVVSTIERADAYTITNKVYYAAVYSDYVEAQPGQGTSGNVIYPTQYYESFDKDEYATTIEAQGYVPDKDSVPGVSNPVTDVPVFKNLYEADDLDGLVATKMMEGRSLTEGDVFTFTLEGNATTKTGQTISVKQTKQNDATGKVRFDELKFALNADQELINQGYHPLTVADFNGNVFTMELTLKEVTENLPKYITPVGETSKTLTVTVSRENVLDEAQNEELDVTISPKNNELVFTNKYDATGTAVISAKKAENSTLGDGTFQFQLLKEDGTSVIEASAAVKQGQTATFGELSYQLSDLGGETYKDFTYKVKEVIPADAVEIGGNKVKDGIIYDTTVHTVVVRMTDDGEGQLTPSYKVDDAEEFSATLSMPTFFNLKAFEFTKDWMLNGEVQAWPDDLSIGVTIGRKLGEKPDDDFSLTYTITKPINGQEFGTGEQPKLKATVTTVDEKDQYKFTLADLKPGKREGNTYTEYTYYVKETTVPPMYSVSYRTSNGDSIVNGESAPNGGAIVNTTMNSFELPSTGGSGTLLYTLGGLALILLTGVLLISRRRRKV